VELQGATELALTKLDVLDYMDEIPVCTAYRIGGRVTTEHPFPALLSQAEPVTETMKGWHCDITKIRRFEDLPDETKAYVERIENAAGCHIRYISVGAEREAIILH